MSFKITTGLSLHDKMKHEKQQRILCDSEFRRLSRSFGFTLKEDVDVADKALAADVRDNMEP